MRGRGIVCAAMAVLGGWIGASAVADAGTYGHRHLSTTCVVSESSIGPMIAARTHWQMWNTPHHGNELDGYRWQARLIPERPGLNLHRPWESVELSELQADADGNYHAAVTTPALSANLDWDLQVKLTWDREHRDDWNAEHVVPFDETSCAI